MKPLHKCLFCLKSDVPFKKMEHIVPESLGNNDLILEPGFVCDNCNQYFGSKIESYVLNTPPFNVERVAANVETKKGNQPYAKINPEFFIFPNGLDQIILLGAPGHNLIVDHQNLFLIPPYNKKDDIYIIRLLLKMGLEFLLTSEKVNTYEPQFDAARKFARYCNPGSWWDLGLTSYPYRKDLRISERYDEFGPLVNHQLYQFEIGQMSSGDMIMCFIYRQNVFACNLYLPSLKEYSDRFNLLNSFKMNVYKVTV